MRRILLVKTSSLGDVVHNLPVVCDLQAHLPDIEVDWAVEDQFASIPALHPGVSQVIPVEPRRWRRSLGSSATWKEIGDLRSAFRARDYDCVVDTQGLIKSAIIARLAPGRRYGLDWSSAREPLRPFYHRTFHVSWSLHAVERNRQLAARAWATLSHRLQTTELRCPLRRCAPTTRISFAGESVCRVTSRDQRASQALARTSVGQAR